jgi:hypothetical protein
VSEAHHVVAAGHAVTTKRGLLNEGVPVTPADFRHGQKRIEQLLRAGVLTHGAASAEHNVERIGSTTRLRPTDARGPRRQVVDLRVPDARDAFGSNDDYDAHQQRIEAARAAQKTKYAIAPDCHVRTVSRGILGPGSPIEPDDIPPELDKRNTESLGRQVMTHGRKVFERLVARQQILEKY